MSAPVAIFAIGNRSRGDDAAAPLLLERLRPWLEGEGMAADFDLFEVYQLQLENALDLEGRCASVDSEMLDLRRRETLILEALVQRVGRVVTRDVLIEAVYGFDDLIESNTLEAQISRLRRKLKEAGAAVEITSLRGIGYMLRVSELAQ